MGDSKHQHGQPSAGQTLKRIFIALCFSADEQAALARTRDAVLGRLRAGHPTPSANIHLTLAFLGMLDSAGEGRASDALRAAADSCGPVTLWLGDLGAFEHRRGGVVWRGIAREEGLLDLQRALVRKLARRDLPVDEKPFVPHVTLVRGARAKPDGGVDGQSGLQRVCAEASLGLPVLETRHAGASFMWSHHPEGGSLTYTPILAAPLRGSERRA
ncbi:MAG: RNA 2',3'-cyclic phosphodiesterase [Coriobacteriaceae bacterium]|uniref:RNA 2',3'-cyclic phosphodiesterase n=1 Tax=Tractidigestivibacter sp. TaxID=2847320 RepID=UPI002A834174|nr:RNA 2',3'-cyclic phosphodiesterase [Tractidigestivibacter sp.]MCI6547818.1 RNA 2',3'-cyclic phosphodiesterase [Coriobacteriaceae bacterium]MDY4533989.1 RNA 2',3'-cyclic phosphodiesterase [Tractidigestivibacter sp.]